LRLLKLARTMGQPLNRRSPQTRRLVGASVADARKRSTGSVSDRIVNSEQSRWRRWSRGPRNWTAGPPARTSSALPLPWPAYRPRVAGKFRTASPLALSCSYPTDCGAAADRAGPLRCGMDDALGQRTRAHPLNPPISASKQFLVNVGPVGLSERPRVDQVDTTTHVRRGSTRVP
jgi:hypothetical protein